MRLKRFIVLFLVASCGSSGTPTGTGGTGGSSSAGASGGGQSGTVGAGGSGGASGVAGTVGVAGTGGGVAGTGGGVAGTGGATAGTGGGVAGTGGATAGTGGRAGTGGSAAGTGGRGGTGGGAAGTGGGAGTGAGGTSARWTCPAGPFTAPNPSSITLTKVAGVPPLDSFNNNGNNFGNIEGDCWFGDALYVSEVASGNNPPPGRILRVTPTGTVSVAFPMSGSNGLAIDLMGRLIGASHTAGAVVAFNLTNMTSTTPIVSQYMGARLNTPNDLTVRSDGTIYFSDPDFQAPSPRPQMMTRVYRLPPGATAPVVVDATLSNPNGVTLSLDEAFLFVTDGQGLWRYPVSADGSTGTGTRIAQSAVGGGGDGMGIDCAGNLYVALQQKVIIVNPTGNGTMLGSISMTAVQAVTNIAFGGTNHQTLYVSGLGNGMGSSSMGLYRADMPLPGMPY